MEIPIKFLLEKWLIKAENEEAIEAFENAKRVKAIVLKLLNKDSE